MEQKYILQESVSKRLEADIRIAYIRSSHITVLITIFS